MVRYGLMKRVSIIIPAKNEQERYHTGKSEDGRYDLGAVAFTNPVFYILSVHDIFGCEAGLFCCEAIDNLFADQVDHDSDQE